MALAVRQGAIWLTSADHLSQSERLSSIKTRSAELEAFSRVALQSAASGSSKATSKGQGRSLCRPHASGLAPSAEDVPGAPARLERRGRGRRSHLAGNRNASRCRAGAAPNGTAVPVPNRAANGVALPKSLLQGEWTARGQAEAQALEDPLASTGAAASKGLREGEAAAAVRVGAKAKAPPAVEEAPNGAGREPAAAPAPPMLTADGFSSIEDALAAIKQGEMVLLVDSHKGGAGNFFMAGALASEEKMAMMVNYGSGLVLAPAAPAVLDKLDLPLMVEEDYFSQMPPLPFTVTVDLLEGTSTGISAADRALTIRHMAAGDAKPEDFRRPGHVIPMRCAEGGVLKQAGHAEAAVDLAQLAGLPPVGVLCAVTNSDGSMASLADLQLLARRHQLSIVSIADLVRYRRLAEKLVERTASARLPTKWGIFQIYSYTSLVDGIEHVAMVKGDVGNGDDVLCRVHSECLTGDIFASERCDCGPQLDQAMERINQAGRGVLVYMRGHEGRGIGLGKKLEAYNLQDVGRDTVQANEDLGLPVDSREYGASAQILRDLGVRSLRLMTNNPAKFEALTSYGIEVRARVPVLCPITLENKRYLETKRKKMGHLYASDLAGIFGRLQVELPEGQ